MKRTRLGTITEFIFLSLGLFSAMFISYRKYSREWFGLFLMIVLIRPLGAVAPGDIIRNQAMVTYDIKTVVVTPHNETSSATPVTESNITTQQTLSSNEVETTVGVIPATLEFLEYTRDDADENITLKPTFYQSKGRTAQKVEGDLNPMNAPTLSTGETVDISKPIPVRSTESYASRDLVIVRVVDVMANLDPEVSEFVEIEINNGEDKEILHIEETDKNTGIFVGYIQVVNQIQEQGDGVLFVQPNDKIQAEYKANGVVTEATLDIAKIAPDAKVYLVEGDQLLPNVEVFLLDAMTGEVRYRTLTDAHGLYHFTDVEAGDYRLYSEYVVAPQIQDGVTVGAAYVDAGYEAFERPLHQERRGAVDVVDIPFTRKKVLVWLEKQASKERVGLGEFIQYSLVVHNEDENMVSFLTLEDQLPQGLKYQANSFTLNGNPVEVQLSQDGRTLDYALTRLIGKSSATLRYVVEVTTGVQGKEIINRAWLRSTEEKVVSNVATAVVKFDKELFSDNGVIIGQIMDLNHSTAMRNVRLYMEDGSYVVSDRDGKFHFENISMGMHLLQLDKESLAEGYAVVPCQGVHPSLGSNFSKFVEFKQGGLRRVDFCVENVEGIVPKVFKPKEQPQEEKMPTYRAKDIALQQKAYTLLWPKEGYMPSIPSTALAMVHPKKDRAEVWLNGSKVSLYNYDTTISGRDRKRVMTLYKGVDLLEGDNLFEIKFFDAKKREVKRIKRLIHVSGAPVRIKYHEEQSTLIADGKTIPIIAVQFFDAQGYPLRRGIQGGYQLDAPYHSYTSEEMLEKTPLSMPVESNRFEIEENGTAYIQLQPTSKAGEVRLHFLMDNKEEKRIKAWLKPKPRDWILVGFAQGTVGYETLQHHSEQIKEEDKIYKEGQVAFFAKGKIKGSWILTMAYNSGKVVNEDQLQQQIDPQKYYTLYGDASEQSFDAPSQKKLYLKIEKENFYTLFGDFQTGFTTLELAQYSRAMQGVKSEYHGKYLEGTFFISQSQQMFKRDEIRGDGSSGFYYLTQKGLIINSESITIEVRDRYHNERVIRSEILRRYRDYEIDYDLGRLYFKMPIYSQDEEFNPQYIVVKYEIKSTEVKRYTYGARTVMNVSDQLALGSTLVHEDSGLLSKELMGMDARITLGDQTLLKLEYAQSEQWDDNLSSEGTAKFAQLEHIMGGFGINGYYREQEGSFGLGQISSILGATRKVGVDVNKRFSRWWMTSSFYRDEQLNSNHFNDVAQFNLRFDDEYWNASLGYRYVADSNQEGVNQVLMMLSRSFLDHRLHVTLARDQTIGGNTLENFAERTAVQVNYNVSSSVELFGTYEIRQAQEKITQTRVGVRTQPWQGATIQSSQQSELSSEGSRVYNLFGLRQQLQLSKTLMVSGGYEKSSKVENSLAEDTAFDAYNLSASYNGKRVAGNIRTELRAGEAEHRKMIQSSLYTQRGDDLALALGGRYYTSDKVGEENRQIDLKTALAYRASDSKWTILSQLNYLNTFKEGSQEYIDMVKLLSNSFANYQVDADTELMLSYGLKHVLDSFDKEHYGSYVDYIGLGWDQGLSDRWGLGFHMGILHSYTGNNMEYTAGSYLGYTFIENAQVRLGYNLLGFRDEDFSLQNYHQQGAYLQFTMKFDQESLKKTAGALASW